MAKLPPKRRVHAYSMSMRHIIVPYGTVKAGFPKVDVEKICSRCVWRRTSDTQICNDKCPGFPDERFIYLASRMGPRNDTTRAG